MGGGTVAIFTGATGTSEENVQKFIDGSLKSSGSVCQEHQHKGSCGGH